MTDDGWYGSTPEERDEERSLKDREARAKSNAWVLDTGLTYAQTLDYEERVLNDPSNYKFSPSFETMILTEQWTHSDQEEWFPGHETYLTREEAIAAGRAEYEGGFWVGRVQELQATDLVSAEDYAESVHERLYERTGCCDWNCDRPDVLSKETLETLTAAINDAVQISTLEVVDIEWVDSADLSSG